MQRIAAEFFPKSGAARPEPGRRLCAEYGERRRKADRVRYARARAEGRLYGGKRAAARPSASSVSSKKRYKAQSDAGHYFIDDEWMHEANRLTCRDGATGSTV